jgi:hypothetical protein
MRRVLFGISVVAVSAVAFVGTSEARQSNAAGSPPDLPNSLPRVQLDPSTELSLSNLIDQETATRFGITADSFKNARLLARLSAGPLYVIPGANGNCVAFVSAASCGMLHSEDTTVAVFSSDPSGAFLVGGGILDSSTRRVTLERANGSQSANLVPGGFVVTENARIPHDDKTDVVVR